MFSTAVQWVMKVLNEFQVMTRLDEEEKDHAFKYALLFCSKSFDFFLGPPAAQLRTKMEMCMVLKVG